MANTQPAKVSYFFGKGYADLGNKSEAKRS